MVRSPSICRHANGDQTRAGCQGSLVCAQSSVGSTCAKIRPGRAPVTAQTVGEILNDLARESIVGRQHVGGVAGSLHIHHATANRWYVALPDEATLLTCPLTELGLVRVLMRTKAVVNIREATALLAALKKSLGHRRDFALDDLGADSFHAYVKTARQTTDGHLLALARRHGARLVGIPGAVFIG